MRIGANADVGVLGSVVIVPGSFRFVVPGHDGMASAVNFAGRKFIHVTPDPAFARFDGANKRMRRGMKVFGSMLVF
jgi:hypothetical protein